MAIRKELTQALDTFFPPRGGVIFPTPVEGRNYLKETLYYMTPGVQADNITRTLVSKMPKGNGKFLLIECCGGMGGNTISFAFNDRIGVVVTYEKDDERRKMLKRNVQGYQLIADKVIAPDAEWSSKTIGNWIENAKGCVVYFDPPWLLPNVPVNNSSKNDYINQNIPIGDYSLEDWIKILTPVAYMIVARVPPKYQAKEVPGWNLEIQKQFAGESSNKTEKSAVLYYTCPENLKYFEPYVGGLMAFATLLQPPLPPGHKDYDPKVEQAKKEYFISGWVDPDPAPVIRTVEPTPEISRSPKVKKGISIKMAPVASTKLSELPIPRDRSSSEIDLSEMTSKLPDKPKFINDTAEDNTEWYKAFRNYLIALLGLFVTSKGRPNEEVILRLVSEENMPTFIQAFTHQTFNHEFNYEVLEALGDRLLGYALTRYMFDKFPDITQKFINNYRSAYLSTEHQGPIGRALKFSDWVLVRDADPTSAKINEDVMESFAGALVLLGDNIRPGLGPVLVSKFVNKIFSYADFDPRIQLGGPKTIVIQLFKRLGLGTTQEFDMPTRDGKVKTTISLPDQAYIYLEAEGIKGTPKPLAIGYGSTAEAARNNAWDNALDTLERFGVTWAWGEERAEKNLLSKFGALGQKALDRAKREGFNRIRRFAPQSAAGKKGSVVQLIGITDLDKKPYRWEILGSTQALNIDEGFRVLLEQYANYADIKETRPY